MAQWLGRTVGWLVGCRRLVWSGADRLGGGAADGAPGRRRRHGCMTGGVSRTVTNS